MNWQPGPPQAAQDKATPPKATSSMSTPGSGPSHTEATGPVVEGDSSLTAHSAFANQFFQEVISTDELQDSSLEMRETLDALHHIVHSLKHQTASSEMSYPNARPSNRVAMPPYDLPPIRKSVEVIQAAKGRLAFRSSPAAPPPHATYFDLSRSWWLTCRSVSFPHNLGL